MDTDLGVITEGLKDLCVSLIDISKIYNLDEISSINAEEFENLERRISEELNNIHQGVSSLQRLESLLVLESISMGISNNPISYCV